MGSQETGCAWDGTPISCSLISFIINGNKVGSINFNVRAEGGWGAYRSASLWRFNVYRESVGQDKSSDDHEIRINTDREYLYSYYELFVSPLPTDPNGTNAENGGDDDIPKWSEIAARERAKPPITDCEKYLATLFTNGGYVTHAFDYTKKGLNKEAPQYRGDVRNDDGSISRGHLGLFAHVYRDFIAEDDADFFIPAGGKLVVPTGSAGRSPGGAALSNAGDSYVLVKFAQLGNLQNVTLFVGHIKDVANPTTINSLRSLKTRRMIGTTGGEGGDAKGSRHIHLELLRGLHNSVPAKKSFIPITSLCP